MGGAGGPEQGAAGSVVSLVPLAEGNTPLQEGSAFFVADGRVITRRRLLRGARLARIVMASGDHRDVLGLLGEDVASDFALLAVDVPSGSVPLLPLGGGAVDEPLRGTLLGGRFSSAATGVAVTVSPPEEIPPLGPAAPLALEGPVGISGAPVVDPRGRVIAVAGSLEDGEDALPYLSPPDGARGLGAAQFQRLADRPAEPGPGDGRFVPAARAWLGGDVAAAATLLRRMVDADFRDGRAWLALAVALLRSGRAEESLEAVKVAEEILADEPAPREVRAQTLTRLGRLREAMDALRSVVVLCPHDSRARNRLGVALFNLGMYPDAAGAFREAIRLNPDDAQEYKNLGVAEFAMGRFRDAVEAYLEAVRIDPGFARAWKNLGMAYHALGDFEKAADASRRAIRIRPDFARAHNNLGVAYQSLGRMDEAAEAYRQALRLRPGFAQAALNLVGVLEKRDRRDEALECLRVTLRAAPEDVELRTRFGILLHRAGRGAEALEELRRAVGLAPRSADAQYALGALLCATGDKGGALDAYKALKDLDPVRADRLFDLVYK